MNESKVSIIIPTYNRSKLLRRAIESIIRQTYKNWELVVVDDGSTDNTKSIVDEYIKKDKRIFYKYQENSGGCSSPKNLGLKLSSGKYITFLDSDDEYLPKKLELQVKLLENSKIENLGFVGCQNLRVIEQKIIENKISHRNNIYKILLENYFITTPGIVMIKRQVIDKIGFFDENLKISDDVDYFIRISKNGFNFDFVDEILFKYYQHKESLTEKKSQEIKEKELVYIYEKNIEDLNNDGYALLTHYNIRTGNFDKAKKINFISFTKNKNIKNIIKILIFSNNITLNLYRYMIKNKK